MAKLVYRNGKEYLPEIELTRKEWEEFRSNTFVKGTYTRPPGPDEKIVKIGGFQFVLDE